MHKMLSNRAPVFQTRLIQMLHGSSQAVILFARSGTNSNLSSSSVLVHTKAATSPPALVPVITRGRSPASRKALTTPTWSNNRVRSKAGQKRPRRTIAKWSPSREAQCGNACKLLGTHGWRTRKCLPRFVFALLKNFFFSSKDNSDDSRMNSRAFSNSIKYAGGGLNEVNLTSEECSHSMRSLVPKYVFVLQ